MRYFFVFSLFFVSLVFSSPAFSAEADDVEIVNYARTAKVSASGWYSKDYVPENAVNGVIMPPLCHDDLGRAWCVRGDETGNTGEFTLEWDTPVEACEVVYFGRTTWYLEECFREYEVYLNDAAEPAAAGVFEKKHGAQRVPFPKQAVRKIRIRFLSAYDGAMNAGATEIMVFGVPDGLGESLRRRLEKRREEYGPLLAGVDKIAVIKRHEIDSSHVYTYHYEGFRPGSSLVVFPVNDPEAMKVLVDSPEGQILGLDVSYDGTKILFSWRQKGSEPYHVWCVDADGENLRQITDGPWHDYDAAWLPAEPGKERFAFLSSRTPQFAYCWFAPVGILYTMDLDGKNLAQLSSNYLNDFTPGVLEDGRIIYSRWEYVDRPAIPIQSLWTIHPDGTNLQAYFGNRVLSPATFMEAKQIPGTTKILCTMTGHNGPTRGAIGLVDRRLGMNSQESIQNLTPDSPVPKVNEGDGNFNSSKQYSTPFPLDDERFLVSARGPLLVRTIRMDPDDPMLPFTQAEVLPAPEDGRQWLCAQPVRPRWMPPVLGSVLDESASWVEEPFSTILLKNVYSGLGPDVKPGEVAAIRIVREMQKTVRIDASQRAFGFQFPVISCGATYAGKMVLGDVPVREDGSAYFCVGNGATRSAPGYDGEIPEEARPKRSPSTGPIYFMALDKEGRAIQRMRSFTHLMPGEQQTCIGCHEDRLSTPAQDETLPLAAAGHPDIPRYPRWLDGAADPKKESFSPGFDYARTVQPIWDKHCISCHNAKNPPNGVDLSGDFTEYFNVSYDVLVSENQNREGSPYVSWIPTYNGDEQNILQVAPKRWGSYRSKLAEIILRGSCTEGKSPRFSLSDDEKQAVFAWIDLNVPYYATSETSHLSALGNRRIYPEKLDSVLVDVGKRRCAECHEGGNMNRVHWTHRTQNQTLFPNEMAPGYAPRRSWTRITHPENNLFLLAPLSREAGGTQKCSEVIFLDTKDPDYQKILRTFEDIQGALKVRPRIDMPEGVQDEGSDACRVTF